MNELSEDIFEGFSSHFASRRRALPPYVFYRTAASLILDPGRIVASLTSCDYDQDSTTWAAFLLTATGLAVVQADFGFREYDLAAEGTYYRDEDLPDARITQAWIRPLTDVRMLTLDVADKPLPRSFAASATLTFADGLKVALPSVRTDGAAREDQKRLDTFLQRLREAISWVD